ncbi:hypothetical protein C0J52_22903 [Blattella germanica]|nr:hypothetical protein C0J52_22903 [Blattella germanica]
MSTRKATTLHFSEKVDVLIRFHLVAQEEELEMNDPPAKFNGVERPRFLSSGRSSVFSFHCVICVHSEVVSSRGKLMVLRASLPEGDAFAFRRK